MNYPRNYILQAAVAAAFGLSGVAAHAGITGGASAKIATVAIKSTSEIVGNPVTYGLGTPLSATTVYYLYVQIYTNGAPGGGIFSAVPAAGTALSSNNAQLNTSVVASTGQLSNDGTFVVYPFTTGAASIPNFVTNISFTPHAGNGAGQIGGLAAPLANGYAIQLNMSIGRSLSLVAPLSDEDTASYAPTIIATVPQTMTVIPSSAFGAGTTFGTAANVNTAVVETKAINVTTGGGVGFANLGLTSNTGSTALLNFGAYQFTDTGNVMATTNNVGNTASSWTMGNIYTGTPLGLTVTGNFAAAVTGGSVFLDSTPTCTNAYQALALNNTNTTASIAAVTLLAYQTFKVSKSVGLSSICMTVNGTSQIPSTFPDVNATLTPAGAIVGSVANFNTANPSYFATGGSSQGTCGNPAAANLGCLYNLGLNAGVVDVRSYIPAAMAGTWTTYIRVINTGGSALPVQINAAFIDPVTGHVGTLLPIGSIVGGGAANFTSNQIEAAIGAYAGAAGTYPRLRIQASAPVDVQHYILNKGTGDLTTLHGSDNLGDQ